MKSAALAEVSDDELIFQMLGPRRRVLAELAVDPAADPEVARIGDLVGGHGPGPHRAVGVEALAQIHLIRPEPELIAHASRHLTLESGDITTGTPAGCGTFRQPPMWLAPGDEVVVAAEGVGELCNPVLAGW